MSLPNKYLLYALRENPFPRTGGAEIYRNKLGLLPIAAKVQSRAYETLRGLSESVHKQCIAFIVHGEWGVGKTHALFSYAKMLQERYGEDRVIFTYAAPAPIETNGLFSEIAMELYNSISKEPSLQDLAERLESFDLESFDDEECLINMISEIVKRDYILYIALDQLEQSVDELLTKPDGKSLLEKYSQKIEDFWRTIANKVGKNFTLGLSVYEASFPRLRRPTRLFIEIRLPILSGPEEVANLIKAYLDSARIELEELHKYGLSVAEVERISRIISENPCYPFSEDAIIALYELSGGIPRLVCKYASSALNHAANNQLLIITGSIIRGFLDPKYDRWYKLINRALRERISDKFLSVVQRIIEVAQEKNLIELWPRKVEKKDIEKLGLKMGEYALPYQALLINGRTLVYISRRTSRKLHRSDVERVVSIALKLRRAGIKVSTIVILSMVSPSLDARALVSLIKGEHNIELIFAVIYPEPEDLGRVFFLNELLDGKIKAKEYNINVDNELRYILEEKFKIKIS